LNFYLLITLSVCSLISSFIGIKFLSPYFITNLDNIGIVLSNVIMALSSGTSDSFKLIGVIAITIFGLILSSLVIMNLFDLFSETPSDLLLQKTGIAFFILLLFLNILTSLYTLIFLVLLVIAIIAVVFLLSFVLNDSYSSRAGSVRVRGHYRRGSFVRSHTRRRPGRF
jgi:hypothetical protein